MQWYQMVSAVSSAGTEATEHLSQVRGHLSSCLVISPVASMELFGLAPSKTLVHVQTALCRPFVPMGKYRIWQMPLLLLPGLGLPRLPALLLPSVSLPPIPFQSFSHLQRAYLLWHAIVSPWC